MVMKVTTRPTFRYIERRITSLYSAGDAGQKTCLYSKGKITIEEGRKAIQMDINTQV